MHVLEDQQQAAVVGDHPQQPHHRLEEAQLRLARIAHWGRRLVDTKLWEQLRELAPGRAERFANPRRVLGCYVVAQRLDHSEIGNRQLGFATRPPKHRPAQAVRPIDKLARQPRLAHAGLTSKRDQPAVAAMGGKQRVLQGEQLLVSPDEPWTQHPV